MKVCTIKNAAGTPFNVRLLEPGDWYGRNPQTGDPCFKAEERMVEFWDARYTSHGPLGQFVSRYYLRTLRSKPPREEGLNLDGGTPAWWVDKGPLALALRTLTEE